MESKKHVVELLSAYLEDELGPDERRRVAEHLDGCGACARVMRGLEDVVRRARTLPDQTPSRDLWPVIEANLEERIEPAQSFGTPVVSLAERRRAVRLSIPQAIAAGLALMIGSGAAVWSVRAPSTPAGPSPVAIDAVHDPTSPISLVADIPADVVSPEVSDELERLERELADNADRLEASTRRVIERNIRVIDRAIEESLEALREDPGSDFFREHLDAAVQRKTDYLRRTLQGPLRSS
jgi:anti-sigma factor RsiW